MMTLTDFKYLFWSAVDERVVVQEAIDQAEKIDELAKKFSAESSK